MSSDLMRLGTCLKITDTTNIAADSATITIKDPNGSVVVNEHAMTQESSTVYSYIYQSQATDTEGRYVVQLSAVSGAYTARRQAEFELQPLE